MSEQEAMAAVNRSGDVGPATPGALVKTGLPGALVKVEDWRRAGIAILQEVTDDATRVAVRDAALRVQQAAEVIEDRERQVAAAEVVQRCNREIGRAHGAGQARNRGGRPRKDADGENRQPGLTVFAGQRQELPRRCRGHVRPGLRDRGGGGSGCWPPAGPAHGPRGRGHRGRGR